MRNLEITNLRGCLEIDLLNLCQTSITAGGTLVEEKTFSKSDVLMLEQEAFFKVYGSFFKDFESLQWAWQGELEEGKRGGEEERRQNIASVLDLLDVEK